MEHVDPQILALLSLGEDVGTADDAAHLATCDACAAELAALRHVTAVARQTTPADVPAPPSPAVWDRIAAELELDPSTRPELTPSPPPRLPPPAGGAATGDPGDARVVPLRRRAAAWLAVAAASAGVAVGAVGGILWASRTEPAPAPSPTVLARADLEPLPGWQAAGVASVERDAGGSRVVVVQLDGDLGTEGYREVWLLAPDLSGMVALGLLEGSSGRFVVPEGIDIGRYSVVDVSAEPFDGDATHSGDSVVRGALGT